MPSSVSSASSRRSGDHDSAGLGAPAQFQLRLGPFRLSFAAMPAPLALSPAELARYGRQILLEELTRALDAMPGEDKVMLKLSLPVKPGLFGRVPGPTLWVFESIGLTGFVAAQPKSAPARGARRRSPARAPPASRNRCPRRRN